VKNDLPEAEKFGWQCDQGAAVLIGMAGIVSSLARHPAILTKPRPARKTAPPLNGTKQLW